MLVRDRFERTVAALCYAFIRERYGMRASEPDASWDRTVDFVLRQHARMPDYLRAPFIAATLFFNYASLLTRGGVFYRLAPGQCWKHIEFARKLGPFRDLMRFYEGLSIFAFGEALEQTTQATAASSDKKLQPAEPRRYEIAIIGSGPGGAITAALLAEAGREVLLVESGPQLVLEDTREFSRDEMERKYRNGGITAAFGRTRISYVEGNCVGGGSEINAGLYHRTPEERLDLWRREYGLDAASMRELLPFFEANERDLSVSPFPNEQPLASLKLHRGAERMGWQSMEVPRWYKYGANGAGEKQSMTRTFIPRARAAGCTIMPEMRVRRLSRSGAGWTVHCERGDGGTAEIGCDTVFVCAGAIHTPALLRRSGIKQNVGNSLRMHPTVKVVAEFPETVNSRDMGVTVHQVKEFSPRLSFGVSVSRAPYISLAMLDHPADKNIDERWPRMAIYYAMITGGNGRIRTLPYYRDPLVSYSLTGEDMRNLADGARKLSELLLAAGAQKIYPTVAGTAPLNGANDLTNIPESLPQGRASLMSVHLFSSCPMGEDIEKCATDSFGKVHGHNNLYVNDASLLCTAPGVNPQGSIMAFARRNVAHFLSRGKH